MLEKSFFTPLGNTSPYVHVGAFGFSGSGKTYTLSCLAIGLHKYLKSTKPIVVQDTEGAFSKIRSLFNTAKVEVLIRETDSLSDFQKIIKAMEEDKVSDVFILDSSTHLWLSFTAAYKKAKNKSFLDIRDRSYLNDKWHEEFSRVFVRAKTNILMAGRAGFEYENEIDEETGKMADFHKSDIKMDAGKNIQNEPDFTLYMQKDWSLLDKEGKPQRTKATVTKDRSTILDTEVFYYDRGTAESRDHAKNIEKVWGNFHEAITDMIQNPVDRGVTSGNDEALFNDDSAKARDMKVEHTRWLEEIQGLLLSAFPSTGADDKKKKTDMIEYGFATRSWTAVELNSVDGLKAGYNRIKDKLIADGVLKSMLIVE